MSTATATMSNPYGHTDPRIQQEAAKDERTGAHSLQFEVVHVSSSCTSEDLLTPGDRLYEGPCVSSPHPSNTSRIHPPHPPTPAGGNKSKWTTRASSASVLIRLRSAVLLSRLVLTNYNTSEVTVRLGLKVAWRGVRTATHNAAPTPASPAPAPRLPPPPPLPPSLPPSALLYSIFRTPACAVACAATKGHLASVRVDLAC